MRKLLLLMFISFCAISCKEDPKSTSQDGNFVIEFLFEKDGCKMYRFKDGTRYIYWTNCEGKINYDYSTGGKSKYTNHGETIISKHE